MRFTAAISDRSVWVLVDVEGAGEEAEDEEEEDGLEERRLVSCLGERTHLSSCW